MERPTDGGGGRPQRPPGSKPWTLEKRNLSVQTQHIAWNHYTISQDHTSGEEAHVCEQLANFGRKRLLHESSLRLANRRKRERSPGSVPSLENHDAETARKNIPTSFKPKHDGDESSKILTVEEEEHGSNNPQFESVRKKRHSGRHNKLLGNSTGLRKSGNRLLGSLKDIDAENQKPRDSISEPSELFDSRRNHTRAIKKTFDQMSKETQLHLHLQPAFMAINNRALDKVAQKLGGLERVPPEMRERIKSQSMQQAQDFAHQSLAQRRQMQQEIMMTPESMTRLSASDKTRVEELAQRMYNTATEQQKFKTKVNLYTKLNPTQLLDLQRLGKDPVLWFYRNQALQVFMANRKKMQGQEKQQLRQPGIGIDKDIFQQ